MKCGVLLCVVFFCFFVGLYTIEPIVVFILCLCVLWLCWNYDQLFKISSESEMTAL